MARKSLPVALWRQIREAFITNRLAGQPSSPEALGARFGVNHVIIRDRIRLEDWDDMFRVCEREMRAVVKFRVEEGINEREVRLKHLGMARKLQEKATIYLRDLDLGKLRPRDALKMLELGMREERCALGLSEAALTILTPEGQNHHSTVEEAQDQARKMKALGMELLEYIEGHSTRVG